MKIKFSKQKTPIEFTITLESEAELHDLCARLNANSYAMNELDKSYFKADETISEELWELLDGLASGRFSIDMDINEEYEKIKSRREGGN